MRRSIISVSVAAALALPAAADAANSINVRQVTAPSSTAVAEVFGTVDAGCNAANCRWNVTIAVADTTADCATTNRVVFISDLQPPGTGSVPFALNYGTPAGPRPEVACLRVYDTVTQGSRVVAMVGYTVPAIGGRFPAGTATPAPATSGVLGINRESPALARDFALRSAGAALHRSLKRRYGRRWTVAGSRTVSCNAASTRSYSCTIRFDGRTLRARVTRLRSGRIGIAYS